jgi:lysophospholipase L1-like esterase
MKHCGYLIAMFAMPFFGWSQQTPADSLCAIYPFLELDSNLIHFPGKKEKWEFCLDKIRRIQLGSSEQFTFLHIGGSHVQAGVLSSTIRDRLADLFPTERGVSQGFVFPYTLAGTNCPAGWRIDETGDWKGSRRVKGTEGGPFGIAAITAQTTDPYASVHIAIRKDKGVQTFKGVRIYGDLIHATMWPEPFSFVCPDSIIVDEQAGFLEWHYAEDQDAVEMVFIPCAPSDDPLFTLQGIQFLDESSAMVHHTIGANGASLHTYLSCAQLADQATLLAPDLVLLGIGVNDAYAPNGRFDQQVFEMRYDSLIRIFKRTNPEVMFIFITNNDTYFKKRSVNKNVLAVQESMYRLAEVHDAGVWDQFEVMGGLQSIVKWQQYDLAKKDRIHFTATGYALAGNLFADAFFMALYPLVDQQNPEE